MLRLGCVGQHLVTDAAVGDIVFPQTKMVGDDSRHRRDAVGVDLLKLLDPAENPVDLGLQMRGFPGASLRRASLATRSTMAASTAIPYSLSVRTNAPKRHGAKSQSPQSAHDSPRATPRPLPPSSLQ